MARPSSATSRPRTGSRRRKKRPATSRKSRWNALPGWVWLILGAALAVFIIAVLHLAQPRHDLQSPLMPSTNQPQAHDNKGRVPVPPAQPPRYSFYQTLPNRDLAPHVPSPSKAKPPPRATHTPPAPAPTAPTPTTHAASTPATADRWLVQVGSYRSRAEADRARARVDLMGVVAHTEAASVNGKTWYRVRIGPVNGQKHAQALRQRLQANGVETMLVQQKG